MTLKVGDICKLRVKGQESFGEFEVIIRGPGIDGYDFTVENLGGVNSMLFHPCAYGPIRFPSAVGRFVYARELTLIKSSQREPTRFAKFIRRIEEK